MDHPRSKRFEGAFRSISRLIGRLELHDVVREKRACHAWASIVGTSIAMRSEAMRLKNGTLYVTVENPAWLAELQSIQEDILERLATELGSGVVQRLRFRIGVLPALPPEPVPEPEPPPLTPAQQARCAEQAEAIQDDDLRERVRRALEAHARRRGSSGT